MLFNSYVFLFAFLPVTLIGFFLLGHRSQQLAVVWLATASLVFYSWWDLQFTPILIASITGNYLLGTATAQCVARGDLAGARRSAFLSIAANLLALGYFKYMNFFVSVAEDVTGTPISWVAILLPVGISFFTFTQIAFQVDTLRGKVGRVDPLHYLLFVTYFPHLIAGPILHHAEMMPQFARRLVYKPQAEALAVGSTVFLLGLAKKLLVADQLGPYADEAFLPAGVQGLTSPEAWRGVLAYTLQIYFDFSAYCDMAIGLSLMFNIKLPANFESPYKSTSIIEFWRRWHMTLSRFLRDYLYIPLGGNRRGPRRRFVNLMATMILGGLWHGAGWTFLVWGFLHGAYLAVNHAWSSHFGRPVLPAWLGWSLTFLAVMIAWVFFRAADMTTAWTLLGRMFGIGAGADLFQPPLAEGLRVTLRWAVGTTEEAGILLGALGMALLMPNIRQIMAGHELVLPIDPGLEKPRGWVTRRLRTSLVWQPSMAWAAVCVVLFAASVLRLNRVSQFLYFQF